MRQAYCNRCHAMIWWGVTKKGKNVPLEEDGWAVPAVGGEVMWDEFGNQFYGNPVSGQIPRAVRMFRPHFLYCPYADKFRKPEPQKSKWQEELDKKRAEEAAKAEVARKKKEEKERIEAAQREFEESQISLF